MHNSDLGQWTKVKLHSCEDKTPLVSKRTNESDEIHT